MDERHRTEAGGTLATLDVRPILAGGVDPLATILGTIERIGSGGALLLIAPFRPEPLEELLGERGWRATVRRLDAAKDHVVEFLGPACPDATDLTMLEAPGPLARVLEHAAALNPGGVALLRLPRSPALLSSRLDPAIRLETATAPDGVTLARIERPADARPADERP